MNAANFFKIFFIWAFAFCSSVVECYGAPPVNMPVGSRFYEDFELLEVKGLIHSGLLSTRPFGRPEGARLTLEALEAEKERPVRGGASRILRRLEDEFTRELYDEPATEIKPLTSAYLQYRYSARDPRFPEINSNGDELENGSNLRAGIASSATFRGRLSVYLNPEYRLDGSSRGSLEQGYLMLRRSGAEVLIGRDSMWWGSGFHGNLLMTNNASALDMIKVTSGHPFLLPWVFSKAGPFRPTLFLARLESERDVSNANLLGMRLDFKPTGSFQVGLSRVFMFGGEGRKSLSFDDWVDAFFAGDSAEHSDSPTNGNQIVSIDASYVFINDRWSFLPFSGIKLYTEWGAEDSSGATKTPTGRANMYGFLADRAFWIDDLDVRLEWANTARNARYGPLWYRHSVFTSGYTFHGRVIGHHMGTDSRDLFLKARYHLANGMVAAAEADFERSGIHSSGETSRVWYAADISIPAFEDMTVAFGAGLERDDGEDGGVFWSRVDYRF